MKKILFLTLAVLAATTLSTGYVGTAPGVMDLGTLERGKSYEAKFYILTDRNSPFLIRPTDEHPNNNILKGGPRKRYDYVPSKASEEDISDWISFSQETYQVDPDNTRTINLAGGGTARSSKTVEFTVSVPQNAEPGYHAGAINLNPDFGGGGTGTTSVQTVGLTQFVFVFKVPGKAERDLKILGVNGKRAGPGKARIDFLMKNNGTVTTGIQAAETTIYNQMGNKTGEVLVGGGYLAPDETRIVKTFWTEQNIETGKYRVEGNMDYITGQAYIDSSIKIPEEIQITQTSPEEEGQVPYWVIVVALLLLASVMYYFEINPVTILGAVGFLTAVSLILLTELPDLLSGILLILVVGYIFYRWI